jgi:hypothetical protein
MSPSFNGTFLQVLNFSSSFFNKKILKKKLKRRLEKGFKRTLDWELD